MSSETPADRPSASSDAAAEARPRRAIEPGDQDAERYEDDSDRYQADEADESEDGTDLPRSPSTPVRLRERLAARARRALPGDPSSGSEQHWSWELPPTPDAERPNWHSTRPARDRQPQAGRTAAPDTSAADSSDPRTAEPDSPETRTTPSVETSPPEADAEASRTAELGEPQEAVPHTAEPGTTEARTAELPRTTETSPSDPQQDDQTGNQRPGGATAWLTAVQPPAAGLTDAPPVADLADRPTDLLPAVPPADDAGIPDAPDPATGAAPAQPAGEPIITGTPEGDDAERSGADPTTKQQTKKSAEQPSGSKRPGQQKARAKGALARPGRQRFRLMQGVAPRTPREQIPDQSHLPPEQRTDLAVRVTDLSITYRTSFEKKPTFRQALVRFGRGQRAVREIKALQNVSFEVRTGSSIGIIGRNGAGKSTLMRALAGILPPTSGTVEVWGRASTLLALGVGFNNSLSGRENIILGGLAAGLSLDEVEDRANEIAEWTELGDFIDMPMRTYSSGMASRVAFAVAVHMEPDILMIDEGLSTGDAHFKDKASAKMSELRDKARAMFLVSHGLGSIKELCDEAIWIDKGHLMTRGEPEEVVDKYLSHLKARRQSTAFEDL